MIPYGRQQIEQQDIDAVVEVLKSDFLTQGPKVPLFEQALKDATGARHAVAVNSATSALHIACLALGLGEGDRLWTSPVTFVASANCGLYCGAVVDFVDIDPDTYNLCPKKLEEKLIQAEKSGTLPKVVIPVHLAGMPCEMEKIHALSKRFGFRIIEDASHAIGAHYPDGTVGDCSFSDITVFSFHPVKIVTTAEGGAALTNDDELSQRLALLRSHGITREASLMESEPHGSWYYEQIDLGFNYRMTELQAALGYTQMQRLKSFVDARNELADRYDTLLAGLPIKLPKCISGYHSSFHLYVMRLKGKLIKRHRQIFEALRQNGVGVNLHYIPVHTQPYYQRLGFQWGDFPEAESYYRDAISLPLFHGMTDKQQDRVVAVLKAVLEEKK